MELPDPANATVFGQPQPTCPTHGRMHYQQDRPNCGWDCACEPARFICHGYDGEGCDYTVTMRTLARQAQLEDAINQMRSETP